MISYSVYTGIYGLENQFELFCQPRYRYLEYFQSQPKFHLSLDPANWTKENKQQTMAQRGLRKRDLCWYDLLTVYVMRLDERMDRQLTDWLDPWMNEAAKKEYWMHVYCVSVMPLTLDHVVWVSCTCITWLVFVWVQCDFRMNFLRFLLTGVTGFWCVRPRQILE